jgi:AcrR family transcriptional regulator
MASGTIQRSARLEPDERKRQILAAARRLFNERHYGAVSADDIAAEAGVARGLINHYFGTKRELYVEVVREMVRVPPPPVPEYVRGTSPEQRIAESIDAWLEMVWRNRETWLASMNGAGLGSEGEIGAIFEEAREEAAARTIAVLGLGPAERARPEVRALFRAYSGMAEAATVQWLEHGRLTRPQVAALLEASALALADDVLEKVLQANDAPADAGAPPETPKRRGPR